MANNERIYFSISMREFDASEVNGVINQLQNSIGKI